MSPATSFAFWTNLYHVLLVHTTLLLGPPLKSWKLQTEMCYEIGGQPFSLIEIEHCILRAKSSRPRAALAKFFLPKCLKGDDPRWLAAQKVPVEPRLNFVLNSGSTSCPGRIPVFRGNDLDAQLDTTSALFLSDNVHVDVASRRVVLPTIMSWYKNDFAESRRAPNRVSKITCATFVARLLDRDKNRASQDATRGLRRDLALVLQSTKGLKISYGEYDWKAPRNTFEPLNFS